MHKHQSPARDGPYCVACQKDLDEADELFNVFIFKCEHGHNQFAAICDRCYKKLPGGVAALLEKMSLPIDSAVDTAQPSAKLQTPRRK